MCVCPPECVCARLSVCVCLHECVCAARPWRPEECPHLFPIFAPLLSSNKNTWQDACILSVAKVPEVNCLQLGGTMKRWGLPDSLQLMGAGVGFYL